MGKSFIKVCMKTMKIPSKFILMALMALGVCWVCPSKSFSYVHVYGEGTLSHDTLVVSIFADIVDTRLCSAAVKIVYDDQALAVESAEKNEMVWYMGDGIANIPYMNPEVSNSGEVVVVCGKFDVANPLEGVIGERVLLGTMRFGTSQGNNLPPDPAALISHITYGRSGSYKNFVATDGTVLDDLPQEVIFGQVSITSIRNGDINGDGTVNLADAILALQISAGLNPSTIIYKEADVNKDDRIDTLEAIYAMKQAADYTFVDLEPISVWAGFNESQLIAWAEADVHNHGNLDALSVMVRFTVYYYDSGWGVLDPFDPVVVQGLPAPGLGELSTETVIPLVPAGETRTVNVTWGPPMIPYWDYWGGNIMIHAVAAEVDPYNSIPETDEGNNSKEEYLMVVLKPNIYLYPEQTADLKVTLNPELAVTVSDPPYPAGGWNITAAPDGTINDQYGYLFYEADVPASYQTDSGWVVPAATLSEWLTEQLPLFGFNQREIDDFIDYWTANLPLAARYAIYPQFNDIVDAKIKLNITPPPDSILRIWFLIEGLNENKNIALQTPEIPGFCRQGFTATEWGVILKNLYF